MNKKVTPLEKQILNAIDGKKIISFDIFDTLILRPYIKPKDLFLQIERDLKLQNFSENRIKAEKEARRKNKHDEITYDQIYKNIKSEYQKAYKYELKLEKKVCQTNPEIYRIYKYALKKGKRIIFTSDMYLPKHVVNDILKKNGYIKFEKIFLSSEHQKQKSSGELFNIVLKELSISTNELLHIGDNKISDFQVPKRLGIESVFYPKVINRFMEEYYNLDLLLNDNSDIDFEKDYLTLSLILGINSIIWIKNIDKNYWYTFGHLYAAPLLYSFTNWIYQTAKEKNFQNIAFIARDGFTLIKIFQLFDKNNKFNSKYVYLPRYLSETANLKSEKELNSYLNNWGHSKENIKSLIQDFAEMDPKIAKKFSTLKRDDSDPDYHKLKDFIFKNIELFLKQSYKKRKLVYSYLQSLSLLKGNLLLVDSICGQARSLKLTQTLINEYDLPIEVLGCYYYQKNEKIINLNSVSMTPPCDKRFQSHNWRIIEFFMSAPEQPIISIQKRNNKYLPKYQNMNNFFEEFRIENYKEVSKGIMDFANLTYNIFGRQIRADIGTLILHINNLLENPRDLDALRMKNLRHTVNHDDNYQKILKSDPQKFSNLRRKYTYLDKQYKKIINDKWYQFGQYSTKRKFYIVTQKFFETLHLSWLFKAFYNIYKKISFILKDNS